jgi:hypothetical protein
MTTKAAVLSDMALLGDVDPLPAEIDRTSAERWAQWVARGAAQDRKMGTRAVVVASALLFVIAAWLTTALLLR